jgi:hypothetical protein
MVITGIYNQNIVMDDVVSSVIKAIGYDYSNRDLYIHFNSGREYVYNYVPVKLFREFRDSPSLGEFYNYHVKGQFKSSAVNVQVKESSKLTQLADSIDEEINNIDIEIEKLDAQMDALEADRDALVKVQDILNRVK